MFLSRGGWKDLMEYQLLIELYSHVLLSKLCHPTKSDSNVVQYVCLLIHLTKCGIKSYSLSMNMSGMFTTCPTHL